MDESARAEAQSWLGRASDDLGAATIHRYRLQDHIQLRGAVPHPQSPSRPSRMCCFDIPAEHVPAHDHTRTVQAGARTIRCGLLSRYASASLLPMQSSHKVIPWKP